MLLLLLATFVGSHAVALEEALPFPSFALVHFKSRRGRPIGAASTAICRALVTAAVAGNTEPGLVAVGTATAANARDATSRGDFMHRSWRHLCRCELRNGILHRGAFLLVITGSGRIVYGLAGRDEAGFGASGGVGSESGSSRPRHGRRLEGIEHP